MNTSYIGIVIVRFFSVYRIMCIYSIYVYCIVQGIIVTYTIIMQVIVVSQQNAPIFRDLFH